MIGLIHYISDPIRKSVGGFKDKIVSIFNTNSLKQTVFGRGAAKYSSWKKENESKTQK